MDAYDDTQETTRPADELAQKRTYRRPELVEFGDVRELTRGAFSTHGEKGNTKRH
jgi:hypothetical protein